MPRQARVSVGDTIYHVINRANGRQRIFHAEEGYQNFEDLLEKAVELTGMRLLGYCIMPNHWHLILLPRTNMMMSGFMGWLTLTHTRQYRVRTRTIGYGHLYQGRYKSFPVEEDEHFIDLLRYVEQNPLRAKLVKRSEDWRWGSLYHRVHKPPEREKLLAPLPTTLPANYLQSVNQVLHNDTLDEIRYSVNKGKPYGANRWVDRIVDRFDLKHTLRGAGRPKGT